MDVDSFLLNLWSYDDEIQSVQNDNEKNEIEVEFPFIFNL